MPVFHHAPARTHQHLELVAELARHLEPPPGAQLPSQPEIYEEAVPGTRPLMRVWVVWSAWGQLSEAERSRIILEAYERARGRQAMLGVSIAAGLTPREAEELGLAVHAASA
jgi:hypothetical protein